MQTSGSTLRRYASCAFLTFAALLAGAPAAFAGVVQPDAADSSITEGTRTVYTVVFLVGLVALLAVAALLLKSAMSRSVAEPASDSTGSGSDKITVAVSSLVAVAIAVLGLVQFSDAATPDASKSGALNVKPLAADSPNNPVVGLRSPRDRETPAGPALSVFASGRQYLWRYSYFVDNKPLSVYHDMVVPENTTVLLDITSSDVAHSWWVPELTGAFEALPGYNNKAWFRTGKAGSEYDGASAKLSGANFANMTTRVRVVTAAEFKQWYASELANANEAKTGLQQQRQAADAAAQNEAAKGGATGETTTPTKDASK